MHDVVPTAPTAGGPPAQLRYGVLAGGMNLSRWQLEMLEHLQALPQVELVLVVLDANPPQRAASHLRNLLAPSTLLYQWHRRHKGYPPMLQSVDASTLMGRAEVLHCRTERRGKWSNYFYPADIETIAGHDLDFLLRFGFNIIRGPILKAARYGVWSCHMMDEQKYRGQPAAYWECYFGDQRSAVFLQRLTHRLDGGVILKKRWVDVGTMSVKQSLNAVYGALVDLPAEVCADILAGSAGYLDGPPVTTSSPIYTAPTNLQMLRILAKERERLVAASASKS
jgi:hypothetical protein